MLSQDKQDSIFYWADGWCFHNKPYEISESEPPDQILKAVTIEG